MRNAKCRNGVVEKKRMKNEGVVDYMDEPDSATRYGTCPFFGFNFFPIFFSFFFILYLYLYIPGYLSLHSGLRNQNQKWSTRMNDWMVLKKLKAEDRGQRTGTKRERK